MSDKEIKNQEIEKVINELLPEMNLLNGNLPDNVRKNTLNSVIENCKRFLELLPENKGE